LIALIQPIDKSTNHCVCLSSSNPFFRPEPALTRLYFANGVILIRVNSLSSLFLFGSRASTTLLVRVAASLHLVDSRKQA